MINTLQENSEHRNSIQWTDKAHTKHQSSSFKSTTDTLNLTPDMIDLLEKAGDNLDELDYDFDYQVQIIYQLQQDMNKNHEKYSVKDAKLLNRMIKQLKDSPSFTRFDDPRYDKLTKNHQGTSTILNMLQLSSKNLDSEKEYIKYIQFFQERISPEIVSLDIYFDLPIDLYQKAFELINELL